MREKQLIQIMNKRGRAKNPHDLDSPVYTDKEITQEITLLFNNNMNKLSKYRWELAKLFKGKRYITIKPTLCCNLNCGYCGVTNAHKYYPVDYQTPVPYQELPASWWIKLINRIKPDLLTISGGEPALYEGIADIVNHAVKKKCLVLIFSNLTLIDEFMKITPSWRVYFLHTTHPGTDPAKWSELSKPFYISVRAITKNPTIPRKEIRLMTYKSDAYSLVYAPDGSLYDSCDGCSLKDNYIITETTNELV